MTDSDDGRSCMHAPDRETELPPPPKSGESFNAVRTPYVVRAIARIRSSRKVNAAVAAVSLHVTDLGSAVQAGWPFERPRPTADECMQLLGAAVGTRTRALSWLAVAAVAVAIALLVHYAQGS